MQKIKVGAVSYLNTKPLLYGIERSPLYNNIELTLDYPAKLAAKLSSGEIDMALLPVAASKQIENPRIVSDYCIGAEGDVVSVALFSQVPLDQITEVYLDYQSRTSVRLAQLLLEQHWKQPVKYLQASEHYIEYINGSKAGVIIGDRALKQLDNFPYVYDLSKGWQEYTGLDFVFAAWIANKDMPEDFIKMFNEAQSFGLQHIKEVIAENAFPYYDLETYYTHNIKYVLDDNKRKGMELFLSKI